MPPQSRGRQPDIEHPGAGTLFVHGEVYSSSSKRSSLVGARSRSRTPVRLRPSSNSRSRERQAEKYSKFPPEWQDVVNVKDELVTLSPTGVDVLLARGVGDYTFLPAPEGLLGRGKFSTVYKVLGQDGKHYALKHTPLHPHHPLIAARLLREPTLLAQLPPHPCLVGVEGWIRTDGHFYLIEQYAAKHIPLNTHPLPLRPSRAAYILDQLVSVIRDCMHRGRVCHRDLKGENVLVDVETGDIVVLDLGLATQFSASEPKLTTCCGSPAFHSPEIVNALNHPPGAITYYGPELDIWCIALTLLALLSASRFPLGPSHRSRQTMASRVLDRLQELDTAYPPHRPAVNWALSAEEHEHEAKEWARVRKGLRAFLEMDGRRRMEGFRNFKFGQKFSQRLEGWIADVAADGEKGDMKEEGGANAGGGGFKQLSFLPSEVKYTLPLNVLPTPYQIEGHAISTPSQPIEPSFGARVSLPPPAELVLGNPSHESDRRVLSYVKYLLRTQGILYHCIPTSTLPLLQVIVPLPPSPDPEDHTAVAEAKSSTPWITALFRRSKFTARSASVPPRSNSTRPEAALDAASQTTKPNIPITYLRCYIQVEFIHPPRERPLARRAQSKPGLGASSSRTPRCNTRPRRSSASQTQPTSRSSSLAPAFLSRASVRNGAVSPPTPPMIGTVGAEESLAVASLQQALLRITEVSPPPQSRFDEEGGGAGTGWWSAVASPRAATGALPGLNVQVENDSQEQVDNPIRVSVSSKSGDSGNTSPVISTPTTPSPGTFVSLAPSDPPGTGQTKSVNRPAFVRAVTSPRLTTVTAMPTTYRGVQPVSPTVAINPLPVVHPHPLSPLSRQVSQTGVADLRAHANITDKNSPSPSTISTSTGPSPSQRRAASRPSSRLNSRAPSRSASVASSTTTSASSTPLANPLTTVTSDVAPKPRRERAPYSRSNSTISSPVSTSSYTIETTTSANGTPPTPRAISHVIVRISDPRALPVLRKVLDVAHDHPVPPTPRHAYVSLPIASPAAADSSRTAVGGGGGRGDRTRKPSTEDTVEEDEEEEERGRPRSREEPRSIGLGLSGSIEDVHLRSGTRTGAETRESSKADGKKKREVSTSRKVFGLLGLGGGLGMGVAAVEEGERRRGSVRTASAPPPLS